MSHLLLKKSIDRLISDANSSTGKSGGSGFERTLGPVSITMLGIGAIVGAGIFTLTGEAAHAHSGPGIVYSFVIAGILCTLAGLCYAEMAAMIPVSGSAYAYAYTTMGEGMAWIIGWALTLEYALGAGVVANGWSGYVLSLLRKTIGINIPDSLLCYTKGPWEKVLLSTGQETNGVWNIPATAITILLAAVLYRGINKSTKLNTIMVLIKMSIVVLFIGLGFGVISGANLHANPDASGLASLVPPIETVIDAMGNETTRYGWLNGGVLTGAGLVFYAYIGFDAVSTVAQEAKNPKRDIPIGILSSLLICTIIYIIMGITLTGVVPYHDLGTPDPIALGIDRIVALRHWSTQTQQIFTALVKIGVIVGLTTVILVLSLGQTRVWYAMSKDGLMPMFNKLHPKHNTPYAATIVTGILAAVCGGIIPIAKLAKVISLGTMMIFLFVCLLVPIMRITSPNNERPFRVPLPWVTGLLGAGSCLWVMLNLETSTWFSLIVFLALGLGIYLIYGRRHSLQQIEKGNTFGPIWLDYISFIVQLIGIRAMGPAMLGHAPISSLIFGVAIFLVGLIVSIKNVTK